MRTHRFMKATAGLALLMASLMALPGSASAHRHWHHPHYNDGLTIAATPDPITAGQGVLIYGQLQGPNNANRRVYLFHRINPASEFTVIGSRVTNAQGYYEFVRADGVVVSNRNWFVTGPGHTHSRTIHELVSAVVTLNANTTTTATTSQPVQFSGSVFPAHPHQRVLLQAQDSASGDGWHTISSTYTRADSSFALSYKFRTPGSYTLRAYFQGDRRNTPGQSDELSLTVQQQQNPSFTIASSAPVIVNGQTATISGKLYTAGSTTTTQPNAAVVLYGRTLAGGFKALQSGTTDSSGGYSFTVMPSRNTIYHVETAGTPREKTANLYLGVQDVVTIALSSSTTTVGGSVTITGTVTPEHSGHAIHLEAQNPSGDWVVLKTGYVSPASTYSFTFTPGEMGTLQLRTRITGGPVNVGGASTPVTLTVSGAAPVSSLPPAS